MHVPTSRNPLSQKHAVTSRKSHRMQHTAQVPCLSPCSVLYLTKDRRPPSQRYTRPPCISRIAELLCRVPQPTIRPSETLNGLVHALQLLHKSGKENGVEKGQKNKVKQKLHILRKVYRDTYT
jgi:hypothetical protein